MNRSFTAIGFVLILCAGLLLNIGISSAMDQQEPRQANALKSDHAAETNSDTYISKSDFLLKALGTGAVLRSGDAEALFLQPLAGQHCFTLTDVIACKVDGPMELLLTYKGDQKHYDLGMKEQAHCYVGRRGLFCDVY